MEPDSNLKYHKSPLGTGTLDFKKVKKTKPKTNKPINEDDISINYIKIHPIDTKPVQFKSSSKHKEKPNNHPNNLYVVNDQQADKKLNKELPKNTQKKKRLNLIIIIIIAIILILLCVALIVVAVCLSIFLGKGDKTEPKVTTEPNKILPPKSKNCSYGYTGIDCDECGVSFKDSNLKIVGGKVAVPHSWPSMALIVFRYKFLLSNSVLYTRSAACGGTLINRNTIITAAHCYVTQVEYTRNQIVKDYPVIPNEYYPTYESMYTVYLGVHNLSGIFDKNIMTGQAFTIKSFVIHPSYDNESQLNDIGMIKLNENVVLSDKIQPACLPSPSFENHSPVYNVEVYAVGWGSIVYEGNNCKNVSPGLIKNWNKQICAGELVGGKDTCQGDSGGPLFIKDRVNGELKYVLIGITSYGDGCAEAGLPGIYTKVSSYLTWIDANL